MKRSLLNLFLFASILHQVHAQRHITVYAGYSFINPKNWNRTIDAYNFARPWLKNSIPQIRYAKTWGGGTSGVIGKGFFLSPEFSYSRYSSSSENPPVSLCCFIITSAKRCLLGFLRSFSKQRRNCSFNSDISNYTSH